MPSVGMRRSTRVFGARVLRSGRRLWTEPREGGKYIRASSGGNEWIDLLNNSVDGGGGVARDRCKDVRRDKGHAIAMDVVVEPRTEELASKETLLEVKSVDRMCGIVYRRKRKRAESASPGLSEDKRFVKKYTRGKWRKSCWVTDSSDICGDFQPPVSISRFQALAVVSRASSYYSFYWISRFLCSVLSYMSKARTEISQLSAFLLSEPIFGAYSSCGLLFLRDLVKVKKPGVCIISGSKSTVPLFVVDFMAIPYCFMHMHTSMHLRSVRFSCLPIAHPLVSTSEDEKVMDVECDVKEIPSQIPSGEHCSDQVAVAPPISPEQDTSFSNVLASDNNDSQKRELSHPVVGAKSAIRIIDLRKSRKIRKRRSSHRPKRRRPSSSFRNKKSSGASASDILRIRQDGSSISAAASSRVLRSSDKKSSATDIKEIKSTMGVLPLDICASTCSANLLVIEADKGYREEGATISLELSSSNQWFLAVMKDGVKRCTLTAHKVMRPSCSNRFTHATVWAADGGWKLEFPNKQDWLIFKELYKECSDRNMQAPAASVIPVPGVKEVFTALDSDYVPFVRPESYITVKGDELTRALAKKTASYDMDSDDEEWLKKFNDESLAQKEIREFLTPDRFELIIDALEKGSHCHPEETADQTAFDYLERKDVVEAIRNYWTKKRKQKRSALVRIFQLYQPRRSQVIPKSVLRKKRSFKRRASQSGRGKQQPFLQAMAAQRDAYEQRNNLQKVQEARAAADRSEELAVLKRQRAQILMENADLATYKAVMALRIAEAAQVSEAPGTVASFLIG